MSARDATRIDFAFDTYIKGSVKYCEQSKRFGSSSIDINDVARKTLIPISIEAWVSVKNREGPPPSQEVYH